MDGTQVAFISPKVSVAVHSSESASSIREKCAVSMAHRHIPWVHIQHLDSSLTWRLMLPQSLVSFSVLLVYGASQYSEKAFYTYEKNYLYLLSPLKALEGQQGFASTSQDQRTHCTPA